MELVEGWKSAVGGKKMKPFANGHKCKKRKQAKQKYQRKTFKPSKKQDIIYNVEKIVKNTTEPPVVRYEQPQNGLQPHREAQCAQRCTLNGSCSHISVFNRPLEVHSVS